MCKNLATFINNKQTKKKFFTDNPTPQADFAIKQAMETIKTNIAFLNNQLKQFEQFFSNSSVFAFL
jgi:hypothetical protein